MRKRSRWPPGYRRPTPFSEGCRDCRRVVSISCLCCPSRTWGPARLGIWGRLLAELRGAIAGRYSSWSRQNDSHLQRLKITRRRTSRVLGQRLRMWDKKPSKRRGRCTKTRERSSGRNRVDHLLWRLASAICFPPSALCTTWTWTKKKGYKGASLAAKACLPSCYDATRKVLTYKHLWINYK